MKMDFLKEQARVFCSSKVRLLKCKITHLPLLTSSKLKSLSLKFNGTSDLQLFEGKYRPPAHAHPVNTSVVAETFQKLKGDFKKISVFFFPLVKVLAT